MHSKHMCTYITIYTYVYIKHAYMYVLNMCIIKITCIQNKHIYILNNAYIHINICTYAFVYMFTCFTFCLLLDMRFLGVHTQHGNYVARAQLAGASQLLPPCGVWEAIQIIRLGNKQLFQLIHLDPDCIKVEKKFRFQNEQIY